MRAAERHGVTLRRNPCSIVADPTDHDLAAFKPMRAHPHRSRAKRFSEKRWSSPRAGAPRGTRAAWSSGDRRPEQGHDAVAGVLVDRPLEAVRRRRGCGSIIGRSCQPSSPSFSESSVEPAMSAKSTVTCLRSPSRAEREVRMRSARCLGVYERGACGDAAPSGRPQESQKRASTRLGRPQLAQSIPLR
jgi:hypothetical protein